MRFLSEPNLKLSALTSSAYRLMLYGSWRLARTLFILHVTINGPVAVMMVVSVSSRPVLKRAVVNEIGALVSCWNCATWAGVRARRRG
jgi:hypothetical protein